MTVMRAGGGGVISFQVTQKKFSQSALFKKGVAPPPPPTAMAGGLAGTMCLVHEARVGALRLNLDHALAAAGARTRPAADHAPIDLLFTNGTVGLTAGVVQRSLHCASRYSLSGPPRAAAVPNVQPSCSQRSLLWARATPAFQRALRRRESNLRMRSSFHARRLRS